MFIMNYNFAFREQIYPKLKANIFLSDVHRNLDLSVLFCMREVDFPILVRENRLSARKTTSTRLTFGIQRTNNIVR